MRRWPWILVLAGCVGDTAPGEDVTIRPGELPLIISAPHGGTLEPADIPDRSTGSSSADINTGRLIWEISAAIEAETGQRPYLIINNLHRKKLDANREIVEAAEGNARAEAAWAAYHGAIQAARAEVTEAHEAGLYIDLHGHSHSVPWVELGYLTSGAELTELSDSDLDTGGYADQSSIRELPGRSGRSFSALLRGEDSLGAMLEASGHASVPSPSNPDPGGNEYYNGHYSTIQYGSLGGGTISGVQVECPREARVDADARQALAESIAGSLLEYLAVVYGEDFRESR